MLGRVHHRVFLSGLEYNELYQLQFMRVQHRL